MEIKQRVSLLLVSLAIFFQGSRVSARDKVFTLKNLCSYTIWPATLAGNNGSVLGSGRASHWPPAHQINSQPHPVGRAGFGLEQVARSFDASGNGKCTTGDCGGKLMCTGSGVPPVTLAEFTIGSGTNTKDFYDVGLVDGYNVGIGIQPSGGTGDCRYAGCVADLNANCPPKLQVTSAGSTVACKSACVAFNKPEYCCTGDYSTPATCKPTQYSMLFKKACPDA